MKKDYRNLEMFPLNETGGWAVKKGRKIYRGKDAVTKSISGWNPYSRVLVDNGAGRFLLPICLPQLGEGVAQSFLKRYRRNSIFFLSFGISLGVFCLLTGRGMGAPVVAVLLGALMMLESFYFMRTSDRLIDRAKFNYWVGYDSGIRNGFYASLIFSLLLISFQVVGTRLFGSTELLIKSLGLVFGDYRKGDWWRLILGAYIHSGGTHLISNIFSLILFFPLAYRFVGRFNSLIVFISANMVAPLLLFGEMESSSFDALVGISGGIFALAGSTWMKFVLDRKSFPLGVHLSFFAASAISIVASYFLNVKSANGVHVAAFLYGAVFLFIVDMIGRRFGVANLRSN